MQKSKKKKLLIFGAAIIVVIIIVANILSNGKNVTEVQSQKVEIIDIVEEVSASGYIQPKTRVNITAEVTAEIIALPVKDGQTVGKGDLLVLLDTVQLQKDVDQFHYSLDEIEARASAAKSAFMQAESDFNRQKELFEKKLTSETVYENAEYAFLNSKYTYQAMISQTKQTRAGYEKSLDRLNKTRITAPMSGVITYLDAETGEIAPAQTAYTMGRTLMTISDLAVFEVEVDVDETEIVKVGLGQETKIEVDAFPDTVFSGEVVEIGNTAVMSGAGNEQSTNFKVKVLFMDSNVSIRPGMSATVDIITSTRGNALAVPYGAIVMRSLDPDSLANAQDDTSGNLVQTAHAATVEDDTTAVVDEKPEAEEKPKAGNGKPKKKEIKGVFVVRDSKAVFVPVETGIADQKNIEVISGLGEDDTVITGPFKTLRSLKSGDYVESKKKKEDRNI